MPSITACTGKILSLKKMKTKRIKTINFRLRIVLVTLTAFLLKADQSCGQVTEVKKWTGTYPDMNGSYPLSFIAFKGVLFPTPYLFVRTWPTHYYVNAESVPVTDAAAVSGEVKTGLLRMAEKLLERTRMEGRSEKTTGIKDHTELRKKIAQKIFNTRCDQLEDMYQLSLKLTKAFEKIDRLGTLNVSPAIKEAFEKEAGELCSGFLLINLLESGHGQKIDSFSETGRELDRLLGALDYTFQKLSFFETFGQTATVSYTFLTR